MVNARKTSSDDWKILIGKCSLSSCSLMSLFRSVSMYAHHDLYGEVVFLEGWWGLPWENVIPAEIGKVSKCTGKGGSETILGRGNSMCKGFGKEQHIWRTEEREGNNCEIKLERPKSKWLLKVQWSFLRL